MNWIDARMARYAWWRKFRGLPEPMSPEMERIIKAALRAAHEEMASSFIARAFEPIEGGSGVIRIRKPVRYVSKV